MISKPAKIIALQEEIEYAKTCLRPHDTGYIHTSIHWMEYRVKQLREELEILYKKDDSTQGLEQ